MCNWLKLKNQMDYSFLSWIFNLLPAEFLNFVVAVVNGDSRFRSCLILSIRQWYCDGIGESLLYLLLDGVSIFFQQANISILSSEHKTKAILHWMRKFRINIIIMNARTNASVNSIFIDAFYISAFHFPPERKRLFYLVTVLIAEKQSSDVSFPHPPGTIYAGHTYKWNSIYSMAVAALYEAFE